MTGIILSGGENRRMGTDKAFLVLAGRPLIEHVLSVLRRICDRIIIVTNTPERYARYEATVIVDALDHRGPLTGIYTGLCRSEEEYNIIVACDMPFLNADLLDYLRESAQGYDAALPQIEGLVEPLHAVYHKRLVPVIERRVQEGHWDVRGVLDDARVRYITAEEIDRFDPDRRSFKNLNTRKEYEEAVCSDWGCRNLWSFC